MTSRAYLLLTLVFYSVGALQALVQVVTGRKLRASLTVTATLLGFALHTAGLSQRWTEAGRFPAVGLHDGVSFLAWATVLVYLLVYLRTRVDALGLIVYPVAFGLVLAADLTPASERADPILKSLFLPIHATLAFFGYAALFVACALGGLYFTGDAKEWSAIAAWVIYVLLIGARQRAGWGGRRAALLGIAGFSAVVFIFVWMSLAPGVSAAAR